MLSIFLWLLSSRPPNVTKNPTEDPQRAIKILEHQKLREMMAKLSEQAFIYLVTLTGNYRCGGLLPDWVKQSIDILSSPFYPGWIKSHWLCLNLNIGSRRDDVTSWHHVTMCHVLCDRPRALRGRREPGALPFFDVCSDERSYCHNRN